MHFRCLLTVPLVHSHFGERDGHRGHLNTWVVLGLQSPKTLACWRITVFHSHHIRRTHARSTKPSSTVHCADHERKLIRLTSRCSKRRLTPAQGCQFAGQTVMFAWANDLIRRDDAKRSIVIACMNMFSVAVYLFCSLLFYNGQFCACTRPLKHFTQEWYRYQI